MPEDKQTDCIAGANQHHLSAQQQHQRKEQVLTRGTASVTRSIADTIVIKDGNLFLRGGGKRRLVVRTVVRGSGVR